MREVGFFGGGSAFSLGPVSDVVLFFGCITSFVIPLNMDKNWSLITDKFYRRYLGLDELDDAIILMNDVKKVFSKIRSSSIEWNEVMIGDETKTTLNPRLEFLSEIFFKYFEAFEHCVESAKIFYSTWGKYKPVRVGIANIPHFMLDERRPLSDYDNLSDTDKPFWLK